MDIIVDNWKKQEHMRARYSKHKWSPLPSSDHVEFDGAGDLISVMSIIFRSRSLNRPLQCYLLQYPHSTNPRKSKIHDKLAVSSGIRV